MNATECSLMHLKMGFWKGTAMPPYLLIKFLSFGVTSSKVCVLIKLLVNFVSMFVKQPSKGAR